jgi:hypothetical protein
MTRVDKGLRARTALSFEQDKYNYRHSESLDLLLTICRLFLLPKKNYPPHICSPPAALSSPPAGGRRYPNRAVSREFTRFRARLNDESAQTNDASRPVLT